jgi:hypothetical protein
MQGIGGCVLHKRERWREVHGEVLGEEGLCGARCEDLGADRRG